MKLLKPAIILITIIVIFSMFIKNNSEVCFDKKCVQTELADTPEKRMSGLMFKENLPENEGMLFVYDKTGTYSFWMKNTLIPLDIIWIDENYKVVHIEHAVPCTTEKCLPYKPTNKSKYVLETNSRFTDTYDVKTGDKATIKL